MVVVMIALKCQELWTLQAKNLKNKKKYMQEAQPPLKGWPPDDLSNCFFFCRPNPEDYIPPESDFHWALSILPMLRLAINLINHATFPQLVNIAFVCVISGCLILCDIKHKQT